MFSIIICKILNNQVHCIFLDIHACAPARTKVCVCANMENGKMYKPISVHAFTVKFVFQVSETIKMVVKMVNLRIHV